MRLLPPGHPDSMDERVYRGENAMLDQHGRRRFDTLADIRRYVRELVVQDWFRRRWPQKMLFSFRDGRGVDYAACESADGVRFVLTFPRAQRERFYVLHEVAHACTWNDSHHDHGLIFRDALLILVRRRMGRAAVETLQSEWGNARLAR